MSTPVRQAGRLHRAATAATLAVLALLAPAALAGTAHADTATPNPLASPTSDDAMLNLLLENGVDYTTSTTPATRPATPAWTRHS